MSIIWADFPSGQQGIYGTSSSRMLDGIWAEAQSISGFSNTGLVTDPDPAIGSAGIVFRVGTDQGGQTANRIVLPGGATQTLGVAYRLYMTALPSSDTGTPYVNLRDNLNNFLLAVRVRPDGSISVHSGAYTGTELGRSGPVLTANSWNHVEFKAYRDAASGTCEVRVNGVTVLNLTGLALGTSNWAMVGLCVGGNTSNAGRNAHYKDLIIWDGTGTVGNDFQGSVSVRDLYPDADIALNWAPSTGGNGWSLIDETTPNDVDYIQAGDPPPSPYVASLTDLPEDVTSVRALLPIVRSVKTDGGDCNLQISLTPNNTNWDDGADRPLTTAYKYTWDVSEISPATSVAWTPVEVNAAYVKANRTL